MGRKWNNIKNKKGAQDKARGQVYTRLLRYVTKAVKSGGEHPEANFLLGMGCSLLPRTFKILIPFHCSNFAAHHIPCSAHISHQTLKIQTKHVAEKMAGDAPKIRRHGKTILLGQVIHVLDPLFAVHDS